MEQPSFFIIPSEDLPDKLVKVTDEIAIVSWRAYDGNHQDRYPARQFKEKHTQRMLPLSEEEYKRHYAQIFTHYDPNK
jgi:hypothetical protein